MATSDALSTVSTEDVNPRENAEDDGLAGDRAMEALQVGVHHVVLGVASSGRTPFVVGALAQARARGAATAALVAKCRRAGSRDG